MKWKYVISVTPWLQIAWNLIANEVILIVFRRVLMPVSPLFSKIGLLSWKCWHCSQDNTIYVHVYVKIKIICNRWETGWKNSPKVRFSYDLYIIKFIFSGSIHILYICECDFPLRKIHRRDTWPYRYNAFIIVVKQHDIYDVGRHHPCEFHTQ